MATTYTSGVWRVKEGHDEAFVQAWTEFVSWAKRQPGASEFHLVRDLEDDRRYMSFAPWDSFDAQHAWKQTDEFTNKMQRVREHVDSFEPATYELVADV